MLIIYKVFNICNTNDKLSFFRAKNNNLYYFIVKPHSEPKTDRKLTGRCSLLDDVKKSHVRFSLKMLIPPLFRNHSCLFGNSVNFSLGTF